MIRLALCPGRDDLPLATVRFARLGVIGGAEIYALSLPCAGRLQLTEVAADFDGDTYFPEWARGQWQETQRECHRSDAGPDYSFVTYERIQEITDV